MAMSGNANVPRLLESIAAPFRKNRSSSASTRPYEKPAVNGHTDQNEKQHTRSPDEGLGNGDIEKQEPKVEDEYADQDEIQRAHDDGVDRLRYMRVVPPWVKEADLEQSRPPGGFYTGDPRGGAPARPATAQSAQHNHTPAPRQSRPAGRKFDHARDGHGHLAVPLEEEETSQLMALMRETQPRPERGQQSQVMSREWLDENIPDFTEPWHPAWIKESGPKDARFWLFSPEGRVRTWNKFMFILMRNPFVPLVTRLTVLAFVLAALGLGVNIYRESNELNSSPSALAGVQVPAGQTGAESDAVCKQQPSTYLAFIVDSVAVLYIIYITWDEYFSKPLGLRKTKDKIRLLFLDLLFVILSAANLSLAFNTLTDQQWSCYGGPLDDGNNSNNAQAATTTCVQSNTLCERQKGLCAVLLLAEVAWVLTFAISIFRVVERIQR